MRSHCSAKLSMVWSARLTKHVSEPPQSSRNGAIVKSCVSGRGRILIECKRPVGFVFRQEPFLTAPIGIPGVFQDRIHPSVPLGAGIAQPGLAWLTQNQAIPRLGGDVFYGRRPGSTPASCGRLFDWDLSAADVHRPIIGLNYIITP